MKAGKLICTGRRILLAGSENPASATIIIDLSTGKIIETLPVISTKKDFPVQEGIEWIDAGESYVLPGLVDAHVHLNEPGRTEWEGFWTGTRAAVSGGVTTVVDMPLNSIPPTTNVTTLAEKRTAAQGQCFTDVAFWGGVIPGNQDELPPLVAAGVKGFKCFLIESGVEEFPCVSERDLVIAMNNLKELPTVLLFHAELERSERSPGKMSSSRSYQTFLESRPQELESAAITLIAELQSQYPSLRCHIVHLSAASSLPIIRLCRSAGLPLSVETCFHYLCLASGDIPAGRPEFKCCPPIREDSNRDLLWDALKSGDIDFVVSDHSPCVAELKLIDQGDIMGAWGGISTLGLGLSLLWTEGKKRDVSIAQIIRWTSTKSAEHAGLGHHKGQLKVGYDGDFFIWDPEATFEVTKERLHFKNKLSPYEGRELFGQVDKTFLRGNLVYDRARGGFEGISPIGQLL